MAVITPGATCDQRSKAVSAARTITTPRTYVYELDDEVWDTAGERHFHQEWSQYFRCSRGHQFTWRNNEPCVVQGCVHAIKVDEGLIGCQQPASAAKVAGALDEMLKELTRR